MAKALEAGVLDVLVAAGAFAVAAGAAACGMGSSRKMPFMTGSCLLARS